MHKKLIFIFFLIIPSFLLSQKEGNFWYFGNNAGIDFNLETPIPKTDGAMVAPEGCVTISDNMGNLLFYSNGIKVWNKLHEVMPNGDSLLGNVSSTQSSLIVKKPGPNSIYYLFTNGHQADDFGLKYSEVDIGLDGGLGDVNSVKNITVQPRILEKVTAIRHANMVDFWIIIHLWDSTHFYTYALTEFGFDSNPVISDVGSHIVGGSSTTMGYMRANQAGDRLALANGGFLHDVEVFDFNNETGEITNAVILDDYELDDPYGLEFSPDGNLLYSSVEGEPGTVYQYNLLAGSATDIKNSRVVIGSGLEYGGALQLAPNGKIYHAGKDEDWLGVIHNPNMLGTDCDYELEGFYLEEKLSAIGLPNYVNSIYQEPAVSLTNVCDGDSTVFTINFDNVDSVFWNFGDSYSGQNNYSTEMNPTHFYSFPGSYNVDLTYYIESTFNSMVIPIIIYPNPDIDLGVDTLLCEGDEILLDATTYQAYYKWQDGSTESDFLATVIGDYWVYVISNTCIGMDTISLENCDVFLEMPNVFSPNGDGINEFFIPLDCKDIKSSTLIIYDRWGKRVYESDDIKEGWDGSFEGKKSNEGVYYYVIHYISLSGAEHQLKGSTTLVR